MQTKVKIIRSFYLDLIEGKSYTAFLDKKGLWVQSELTEYELNLDSETNKELIHYEVL